MPERKRAFFYNDVFSYMYDIAVHEIYMREPLLRDPAKKMFWPSEFFHLAGRLLFQPIDNPLSGNWEAGRASGKPRRDTREALI